MEWTTYFFGDTWKKKQNEGIARFRLKMQTTWKAKVVNWKEHSFLNNDIERTPLFSKPPPDKGKSKGQLVFDRKIDSWSES